MANSINRILVAIRDLHHPPRTELRKAAELARAAHAKLELFHAVDIPVRTDRAAAALPAGTVGKLIMTKLRTAEQRLQQFARMATLRGIDVTQHANADYPAHEAVVRRAERTRADLVIAGTRPHGFTERLLLRNTDWELIRQCPCPLLLVKSARSYAGSAVLAAVDPFHTHAKPADLDMRLLDLGNTVAQLIKGSLHVFHAYTPLLEIVPLPTAMAIPAIAPPEAERAYAQLVTSELARLAVAAGVPVRARHLRMGVIANELCEVAKTTRAGLVVMGAVSRSRLKRLFIGSTAESALDKLDCDVLVVKPRGFKSAVGSRAFAGNGRKAA
ncbi:MAG: universal stress protein [Proteobacteria bacterium]|nr:universal stress protein [Pseudomonadota bacterium]